MDTNARIEAQLQAEIEALRGQFPNTQDLYREVCALLFFRHGITPTANKLYQLVRKGSMSAPAEALGKFWAELREKSRVRLEHPDLPDDLKVAAGELVSTLWTKAQGLADKSMAVLKADVQAAAQESEAARREAEAAKDVAREKLNDAVNDLDEAKATIRELEQRLAGEVATRLALEGQLENARQAATEQQKAMDDARRDFASELEKLRQALKITEERYQAAESRALIEIDRERMIAAKLQKDVEGVRALAVEATDRHQEELRALQGEIGNQKQRIGVLEGNLQAAVSERDRISADAESLRLQLTETASKAAGYRADADNWRCRAEEAQLAMANQHVKVVRRPRKATPQKVPKPV